MFIFFIFLSPHNIVGINFGFIFRLILKKKKETVNGLLRSCLKRCSMDGLLHIMKGYGGEKKNPKKKNVIKNSYDFIYMMDSNKFKKCIFKALLKGYLKE